MQAITKGFSMITSPLTHPITLTFLISLRTWKFRNLRIAYSKIAPSPILCHLQKTKIKTITNETSQPNTHLAPLCLK